MGACILHPGCISHFWPRLDYQATNAIRNTRARATHGRCTPYLVGFYNGSWPIAEQQLRRALALSDGDPAILVSGALTITLWVIVVMALLLPVLSAVVLKRRDAAASSTPV